MPLINSKIKMKLRWIKKCVLATAGNDTADASSSNIIFTIQDAKLYVSVITF